MVNLSHNEIVEIERYALHQVSIFSVLDVSFNYLQTIHSYGLLRLLRLDVSHNQLTDVENDAFMGLHQTFQQLNLAFNNLTTFYADALFHQTNALHTLDLSESETHINKHALLFSSFIPSCYHLLLHCIVCTAVLVIVEPSVCLSDRQEHEL